MDWKNKRVLVTGGAGLIGSHLVDALVEKGADVVILDNLDPQTHPHGKPEWVNKQARFVHGDMRVRADIENAIDGVEYVFHQAAFGGFTPELSTYIEANATGTALLFEVIRDSKVKVKKIVAASSQAVYGEGAYQTSDGEIRFPQMLRPVSQLAQGRWEVECSESGAVLRPLKTSEEKPLYTETIYGISKLAEEKLVIGLGRKLGIPTVALRYAVTYGPRQSLFNPYTGVVSIFSTQILNDIRPTVYEDGEQTRDYLYVGDNVRANILVMEDERANMQIFNVGSGCPVSVNRLVRTLAKQYGKPIEPLLTGEYRPGDVRHFFHDISKISKLGFSTTVSLEEGLRLYGQWILSQKQVGEVFTGAKSRMLESGIVHSSN